jgi:PKD repeat protein
VPQEVTITANPTVETNTAESFTTDVADTTGLTFAWNFGDGGTDSSPTPQHTYTVAGNYSVTLTVSNAGGSSVSATPVGVQSAHYTNVAGQQCSKANSAGWCFQNELVAGHALTQAQIFPKAQPSPAGWVIGKAGTLVNTTDGGNTWALHNFPALDDLLAENFSSQNDGVVIFQSGVVQQTGDGKNWAKLLNNPPSSLSHPSIVSFDGASLVIVTDDNGTQTTTDDGATWANIALDHVFMAGANCWSVGGAVEMSAGCTQAPVVVTITGAPPTTQYFAGAAFGTSGARIVVLGKTPSGAVTSYVSTNSGASWVGTAQTFAPGGALTMVDTNHVWYLDAARTAYLSVNGGFNFSLAPTAPGLGASPRAGLVDNTDALFNAWTGGMAVSSDYGATFTVFPSPEPYTAPASSTNVNVNLWNAHGDGTFDALVSFDGRYYLAHNAQNGIATWVQVLGPNALAAWAANPAPIAPALAFASDAKHGVVAEASGLVQNTTDGGQTWSTQLLTGQPVHSPASVAYASPTAVWMTLGGSLWGSSDAGATWAQSTTLTVGGLIQTAWPDATHGFTATANGVWASADGGATWQALSLGSTFVIGSDQVSSIAFESAQVGVVGVARSDGTHLLRTADGGATWNETGSTSGTGAVVSSGAPNFWVGGAAPLLSGDDGQTWSGVGLPAGSTSLQVFGGLGTTIYAFDNRGHVLTSADNGTTWTDLTVSSDIVTGSGFALDTLTVWTINQFGIVSSTATGGL